MNLKILSSVSAALLLASASTLSARYHAPYEGSRIYWDISSQKEVFPSGGYARLIQLQDGRLMAVAESGGGISVSYSIDGGNMWTSPELIIRGTDRLPIAVPDLIQLTDGTIIVGYNPRPRAPYSTDRLFGIRALRSTDNGKTWSDPIFIFDAHHTFDDGCWEPSFLELPSGEIHCYFANEAPFTSSNEQEISVSRSHDGGLTWSEPDRVCFRAGSRDGMPSAIITDAGEIVVIVEDNGHPGYNNFRATTMRCPLEENWSTWVNATSPRRNMIFANNADKQAVSAAPYIRKLKSGETVASWQGNQDRPEIFDLERFDMFVAVGDADARNFRAITQPFCVSKTQHGFWNSVAVIDDGTVFAISSIGQANQGSRINVMQGHAMRGFEANFGTPEINGSATKENWTCKNAQQVFMGVTTRNRATMDFLYDNENLYFYARVVDRTIYTDKVDNDGVFLYLDLENCSDNYPQKGMFRLFLNVDGTVDFSVGGGNKWTEGETPEGVKFVASPGRSYYDLELAVPWKALGYDTPPTDKLMRCNIEVRDRRDTELVIDRIPETESKQSWTWPEFRLNGNGGASVEAPAADGDAAQVTVNVTSGQLRATASREIRSVNIYSMAGALMASAAGNGNQAAVSLPAGGGLAVAEILFADGTARHTKVAVR